MPTCEICGDKSMNFAGQASYIVVPGIDSYVVLCKKCDTQMHNLKSKVLTIERLEARDYFKPFLENGDMRQELSAYISSFLPKTDVTVDEFRERIEAERKSLAEQRAKQKKLAEEEKETRKKEALKNRFDNSIKFKMTTGYQFDGYKISEYIGVISGEVVLGTGFLAGLSGLVNDTLGTRSGTYEAKMGKAKDYALNEAKERALNLNANALIGIDFDYMTVGNNMIVVSANGTAVRITKEEE